MSYLHSGSLPLTEIQVSLNSPLPSFNKVRVTKHQPLSINKHSLNQVTGLTSGMNTEVESGTVLDSVVDPCLMEQPAMHCLSWTGRYIANQASGQRWRHWDHSIPEIPVYNFRKETKKNIKMIFSWWFSIWLQNEPKQIAQCYLMEHKQTKDSSPVSTVLFCRLYCLEIEVLAVIELKDGAASGQCPLRIPSQR